MALRFARSHRLTRTDEFSSVFGFRKAIRGALLMLHYQPRTPAIPEYSARLGLVVGKKQLKRAVDRNRLKRIVRDDFRLHRAELPAYDLIVRLMVRPAILTGELVRADLHHFWRRLPKVARQRAKP